MITPWVSEPEINALCWTLVHSLWLALVVAALAGAVLTGTPTSSPRLRYRFLGGCLLLLVLLTGFVFYRQVTGFRPTHFFGITATAPAPAAPTRVAPSVLPGAPNQPGVAYLTAVINQKAGLLITLWLVFVGVKSLQLLSGLRYIHRLRHQKVSAPDEEWQSKVLAFSRELGIQRSVALWQSELVNIPVTVGHFKPIILLPMGLLFRLPPEQIEAILWHELAHIRRQDYLLNLLQSLVEVVFFFNPALRWLSSRIREEREMCCDELVLARPVPRGPYLEALLAFEVHRCPAAYTVALGSGGRQLVNRLQRIITQKNKSLSMMERIVLLAGLVLTAAFAFIPKVPVTLTESAIPTERNGRTGGYSKPAPASASKQPFFSKGQPPAEPAARPATVTRQDTALKLTNILFVNGRRGKANHELLVSDDEGNHYRLHLVNNLLFALEVNGAAVPAQELSRYESLRRRVDFALNQKQQRPGSQAPAPAKAREGAWAKTAGGSQAQAPLPAALDDQQRVRGVLAALVAAQVVTEPASVVWFGLSAEELVVNGQKQPEALAQQLAAQYGIKAQYGLYYGPVKMIGTGVFLDKSDVYKE